MLQNEFEMFNDEIKIAGQSSVLRDKRKMFEKDFRNNFPKECEKFGLEFNSSDLRFILQGSFKLNTTIKSNDSSVDMDLAVILPVDINEFNKPVEIKKAAKKAIEISNRRFPIIKEPCVTVQYIENGEETLHLDFPIYGDNNNDLYLARGKEHTDGEWERSDPKGLNDYFLDRLKVNSQLRRIIRFLKQWKQEVYTGENASSNRPPSIGLTLIAVDNYLENISDLELLLHIFEKIKDSFQLNYGFDKSITNATIKYNLPTIPFTNVFKKFNENKQKVISFYHKTNKAIDDLQKALEAEDDHNAGLYVQRVLGDNFPLPSKQVKHRKTHATTEHRFGIIHD